MQKIILFYKFAPVDDPTAILLWQRALGEHLQLKGRVIIAPHGINGTLGGEVDDLKRYIKHMKEYPSFEDMAFKWSDGAREDFPKLSVKVRPEIVTFGAADEISVNKRGIIGGGQHLKPRELHSLLEERGDEVVFFDGRNRHEAAIGKFKGAVVPDVDHTRDFISELESGKYDEFKHKPVVTYCTGGIRCEVLSTLMKHRGFDEVYQLDGGIAKYGETYGDEGLWEGSLYVFDKRLAISFSPDASDIGSCVHCGSKTSQYANCANLKCNDLMLVCLECSDKSYCPRCMQKESQSHGKLPSPTSR